MSPWSPRRVRQIVDVVRALWFTPALMALSGVVLGVFMPVIDALPDVLGTIRFGWLRTILDSAPAGAQQLLATSAGALATILGVAFSLTLVTFQLAAAQYTPRLVGRLLEDPITKLVLGSYIGTVAYLLLVLRAVHGVGDEVEPFVPRLSLLLALLLILGCLGLLAYFVHHLGESILAANVGARVVAKTLGVLNRLRARRGAPCAARSDGGREGEPVRLLSDGYGYVQMIDLERLAGALPAWAELIRVEVAAGDYLLPGMPLLSLWPGSALDTRASTELSEAFALGTQRTLDEDVLYGIRQLADVALKGLSPGVNDETTAVTMVNLLGTVLAAACSARPGASGWRRHDLDGVVVIAPSFTIRRIVEDGFAGIVRFSSDHPRVLARVLEVLADVAARLPEGDARDAMLEVGEWVEASMIRGELAAHERRLLTMRLDQLRSPRVRAPADHPHELH